ncbi:MAG TPA: cytochrome c maturation protein CcmE, partial [Burkholderiaceae bacterium]|nr:cytochrome c maturation protein CcmE [Burkholderiaceae bacterium]
MGSDRSHDARAVRRGTDASAAPQVCFAADKTTAKHDKRDHSMKKRHQRIMIIGGGLISISIATALVLNAFQDNLLFFFTPTQVSAGEAP